jgi:ubiquinone/menaquinone biosynthesis C-methylase UbiE
LSLPLARSGGRVTGVDRSSTMLARARARKRRVKLDQHLDLVRADIRALPFASGTFRVLIAPYGITQSVLTDRDLLAVFTSAARVLKRHGLLGIDVVTELPRWPEYQDQVQLQGRRGPKAHLTLIESVAQDRRRHITTFAQRFVTRIGRRSTEHRFELRFRTLSLPRLTRLLAQAGFTVDRLLGDYSGHQWRKGDETMIIIARRT